MTLNRKNQYYSQRFSVAPMLDWTTRHCRVFHRTLSKHAVLYTEMVTTTAILHSKSDQLYFRPEHEGNVILQLGGSDPSDYEAVGKILQQNKDKYPYFGVNINVGCPSPRVSEGNFGACLMQDPEIVANCIEAFASQCDIPVSVKTRIGVDDVESFEFLEDFILPQMEVGVKDFTIHARKAYLEGLSPKENREVPPLNYQRVYDLKAEYPQLNITINGGITDMLQAREHLAHVDGVMIGRQAYNQPSVLLEVDALLFDDFDNAFSEYNRIFDNSFILDQEFTLNPDKVDFHKTSHTAFENRLKHSLAAGFNVMDSYDPLLEKIEHLIWQIDRKAAKRFDIAIREKRKYAFETLQNPRASRVHAPKSDISDAARFKRAQQLASGQAMFEAVDSLRPYWQEEFERGVSLNHLIRPIMGAFNSFPGARQFRRYLSENGFRPDADVSVLLYAIDLMHDKYMQFLETSADM
ncbi:tRNA dihydrouridine(20/20a) synthase DusA [Psittacicella melopsittaci]|uniref:tRNA-dihydrouridine(20/20a) synthase n=1 Tax=Psittacicella melopsittaci TaxID=2028576 RepID=A0A3A1Y4D9_9GAMM|nr:tRNA dihydrouridine(20/20a) synthase DusA [Psittacicella melopsittaci]RIY32169.1 tRNA dihydrouridine(20/20a) synthase DusA [Psittacicella melopsittaci]